jgi:hypothetical protein
MCTVSYIPPRNGEGFILTSNRDERMHRETAVPGLFTVGDVQLCFPKDLQAGGSWIAANNEGRLACLLNGGFEPHEKKTIHTYSRGKVLIDLVSSRQDPMVFFSYADLTLTEPFTVVSIDLDEGGSISGFVEFVWDGSGKYMKNLDPDLPRLWSSVTLYLAAERKLRKVWFDRFLQEQGINITPELVLAFHSGRHTADERINLVMQRDKELKTVSITQVTPDKGNYSMKYDDLVGKVTHIQKV